MDYFEEHKAIYETYFEAFLACREECEHHTKGAVGSLFRIHDTDTLPIAVEKLIDRLVADVYEEYLSELSFKQLFAMAEYIHEHARLHAQVPNNAGYRKRDDSYGEYEPLNPALFDDFESVEAAKVSENQPHLLHYTMAVMQFNAMIPILQKQGIHGVSIEKLLNLQRTIDKGDATFERLQIKTAFARHVSTDVMEKEIAKARKALLSEKAKHAAKAKAEMLYGDVKTYVRKRFEETKAKGGIKNMSRFSVALVDELEKKFGTKLHLENPHDRVYHWIRTLNKGESI